MLSFSDRRQLEQAARARIGKAFRPGTQANHRSHVLLYTAFTAHFDLPDFPATPLSLVLFGEFLLRSFRAPKSVTNALASVKGFHLDGGLTTAAFASRRLVLFRRSLHLTLRHVPARAAPMPFEVLAVLCGGARGWGEAGLAFAALLSVAFFSMARLSSLVPPSRCEFDITRHPTFADLRVSDEQVFIHLKWAKCHQDAGQGFSVPLLPLGLSPACPLKLLSELAGRLQALGPDTPLFAYGRSGPGARGGRAFFTAPKARHWLGLLLRASGLDKGAYTFHSLRRGACTRATTSRGQP